MAAGKEAAPIPAGVQHIGAEYSLGVDIHGIAALANKLYGYVPPSESVVESIERAIKKLIVDASWKGKDAHAFQDAWESDASDAKKLSMFVEDAGSVLDNLATALAELQLAVNDRILEVKNRPSGQPRSFNPILEVLQDGEEKSNKLQQEAAKRLIGLYSSKKDSWSVLGEAKERSKDGSLASNLRDNLKDAEDDMDDTLPDDDFDWTGFVSWIGGGAGIGATIGSFFAGVGAFPGSVVGGGAGLVIGGLVGGGKWAADQIDDLF